MRLPRFVAKKLLKTLQALRRAKVSSYSYTSPPTPPKNKNPTRKQNHGNPILIPTNPLWGRLRVTVHQPLEGTCLEPWCQQKQKPQRQVPVIYMANPDGVPSYPGSLRVSGICPPWDNGRDGGSELAKEMLAIWRCKLPPSLRNSSPSMVALTLEITSGQLTGNGKRV